MFCAVREINYLKWNILTAIYNIWYKSFIWIDSNFLTLDKRKQFIYQSFIFFPVRTSYTETNDSINTCINKLLAFHFLKEVIFYQMKMTGIEHLDFFYHFILKLYQLSFLSVIDKSRWFDTSIWINLNDVVKRF